MYLQTGQKQRRHWGTESLLRDRRVLLTIALVAVLAGLKIGGAYVTTNWIYQKISKISSGLIFCLMPLLGGHIFWVVVVFGRGKWAFFNANLHYKNFGSCYLDGVKCVFRRCSDA